MVEGLIFLIGVCVGSFLNVCIHRLPRNESIVWPGSRCPSCAKPLAWYDNIPIISFLVLRARCRSCGAGISWRYPVVELLGGLLAVLAWLTFTELPYQVMGIVFLWALVLLTFVDLEHQILPDILTLPGIVLGVVFSSIYPAWHGVETHLLGFVSSVGGLLLGGGILYLIGTLAEMVLKKEAMGGGDVKFLAAVGAFLGWKGVIMTLFLGSLLGALVGLLVKFLTREEKIPFGPYLALGSAVSILWGEKILSWYLGVVLQY